MPYRENTSWLISCQFLQEKRPRKPRPFMAVFYPHVTIGLCETASEAYAVYDCFTIPSVATEPDKPLQKDVGKNQMGLPLKVAWMGWHPCRLTIVPMMCDKVCIRKCCKTWRYALIWLLKPSSGAVRLVKTPAIRASEERIGMTRSRFRSRVLASSMITGYASPRLAR